MCVSRLQAALYSLASKRGLEEVRAGRNRVEGLWCRDRVWGVGCTVQGIGCSV